MVLPVLARKGKGKRLQKGAAKDVKYPATCHEIFMKSAKKCELVENGYFQIKPASWQRPKWVECIFDHSRGWTVIQNRYSGIENFDRPFTAYKYGFGCPSSVGGVTGCTGEWWLGLEYFYQIQRIFGKPGSKLCFFFAHGEVPQYEYVCYDTFQIDNSKNGYKILRIDGYNEWLNELPDTFRGLNKVSTGRNHPKSNPKLDMLNTKFSTSDTDSDNSKNHCGNKLKSGWWFNDCSSVNLNGEWSDPNGVFYGPIKGITLSKMYIGPSNLPKIYKCIEEKMTAAKKK